MMNSLIYATLFTPQPPSGKQVELRRKPELSAAPRFLPKKSREWTFAISYDADAAEHGLNTPSLSRRLPRFRTAVPRT